MPFKILASLVAVILMVGFTGVAVVKLKDVALAVVTLIGLVMMAVDLWQSLQSKDD